MDEKIEGFYLVSEVVKGSFTTTFFVGTCLEAAKKATEIMKANGHKTKAMARNEFIYWMGY